MTESDAATFASGITEAVRTVRGVYGSVRIMLEELGSLLEQGPTPLHDLGVRVKPIPDTPDELLLRSWEGGFYSDDSDTEDKSDHAAGSEDDGARAERVVLRAGQL